MKSILLIGGGSSVGKTHLARILSERFGIEHICLDHIRRQINDPELHLLGGDERTWDLPAPELCSLLFRQDVASEVQVQTLVNTWLITDKSRIFEGEGIVPKLASQFRTTNKVKAIFVIETDVHRLYRTLYERGNTFLKLTESRRQRVAEMNSLYGQWLLSEAEHYDLPWVSSQPWSSLPERVLDRINSHPTPI